MSLNNSKNGASGDGGASLPAETNGSKNGAASAAAATTAARNDDDDGNGGDNIVVLYPLEPTTIRKSVLSKAITTAINERLGRRKK